MKPDFPPTTLCTLEQSMIYRNGTATLADILDVGQCIDGIGPKMVGYKTLRDLTTLCGLSPQGMVQLDEQVKARGHKTLILPKGEEEAPWALYVFAPEILSAYLLNHSALLKACEWPDEAEGFVRQLPLDWVPEGHPLRRIIDIAFGNFSLETSRSDLVLPVATIAGLHLYR